MIQGSQNMIEGHGNKLKTNHSTVQGDLNEAIGNNLIIQGSKNLVSGNGSKIMGS